MIRAFAAGAAYFIIVFAAGSVLGTLRTLVAVPRMGELPAVILELPFMLLISWRACGSVLRRTNLAADAGVRAAMGLFALALLLLAEAALSIALGGKTLAEHVGSYRQPPVLLGLAAQLAFAAFPFVWSRRARQTDG